MWLGRGSGGLLKQDVGLVGGLGAGLADGLVEALLGAFCATAAFFGHAELFAEIAKAPRAAVNGGFDVLFGDSATDAYIHCRVSFKP